MSAATAVRERGAIGDRPARTATSPDNFEAIYDAYHGRIFGLAYRMMGNVDDARDVTQDAFISAYQNLHKLELRSSNASDDESHLSAWLHRIAANKCIDALRKRNRRAGVDWDVVAQTLPNDLDDVAQPETYALHRERLEQIQRVLAAMTPTYRLALLLHEYQGLSVREVASSIDRSESAVKSMLFRAREQFRALYELERALDRAA